MGRNQAIRRHFTTCLTFLLLSSAAWGGDIVIPEEEAPTTVFSTRIGSADVDLNLLGAWTAGVSFGAGLLLVPGLDVQGLDSFPSITSGFLFSQTPDITLSLALFERYFLNVSIVGDIANDSLQLAYKGASGEALRSVVVGTGDVTIAPSSLMQIPNQATGSLGASAELASGRSLNDILLRWDATKARQKTFVGPYELIEEELDVSGYTRGMYFFLPDTGLDADSLVVLIEDASGAYASGSADGGRKYRKAVYDDVVLDSALGLVTLRNAVQGRVLVHYTRAGAAVGTTSPATLPEQVDLSPTLGPGYGWTRDTAASRSFSWTDPAVYLGLDMTHRKVAVPGIGDCLLLWEPGDNSPFEMDNSYAVSSTPPEDASLITYSYKVKDASASPPTGLIFRSIPAEKRFQVLKSLAVRSTFGNFYPYADPDGLLYGPNRDSLSGALDFSILVRMLNPVTSYTLEQNLVEGSVQVTVNGITETRFEVNDDSGTLTFNTDILPTDRIVVTYRTTDDEITGGDILLAWRDTIPLADWATLSLGAGLRWNANPWTFSQEPYDKSGTLIATAGITGKTDNLSYSVEAGVSYTNPDTSGILRLFNMEGDSTTLEIGEDLAYPASAPAGPVGPAALALTQANRGILWYRNYRSYGALGSVTLLPIDASPAPDRYPIRTGQRMGPYAVAKGSGSTGPVNLVMEYSMDRNGTAWVGTQIPISAGSDVDLSTARSLTFRYKVISQAGTASAFIQMGSISEDLDGTGTLKAESSSTDTGFTFVDAAHSDAALKVGAGPLLTGNGTQDTEDRNANKLLDLEDANRIVTLPHSADPQIVLTPASATSEWVTVTYALTDADRQKLLKARSLRLIIAGTASSAAARASGTLVIDSLTIQGATFWPEPSVSGDRPSITVRQVAEFLSDSDPGESDRWEDRYPDTDALFHSSAETNEVLEISWGGTTSDFTVKGYVPAGTGGIQYQTIVSYFRSTVAGATYTFSLSDTSGVQIQWDVTAPDTAWHEARVSASEVLVDGDPAGAPSAFGAAYGSLSFLTIAVPASSARPGALYVDEMYCTSPAGAVGAALIGTLTVRLPGVLLQAGSFPLVSNLLIQEDVSLQSAGFAPLYGVPLTEETLSSRTHTEVDLPFTRASVDLTMMDVGGGFTAAGGHSLTIPNTASPLTVMDAFALTSAGGFSREDSVTIKAGSFLALTADSGASADSDVGERTGLLTQSWRATLTANPFTPLTLSSSLALCQSMDAYPLVEGWYGARWVREAGLLLPWCDGDSVSRTEELTFTTGMPAQPVGFSLSAKAGAAGSDYSDADFTQVNDASATLSLIMQLGQGDSADTLSISYARALSLTTSPRTGEAFQAETGAYAALLSAQGYMLTAPPIVEIFTDNSSTLLTAWETAGTGTYSPSLSISLQRGYGARILDMLIPSSIECAIGQDFSKDSDLSEARAYIRPKTVTRAINLFGSLGAFPLLPMVRTDEYSLSTSASVEGRPGAAPILADLSLEAYATLSGEGENELTVMEAFTRTEDDSLTLSSDTQILLDWNVFPAGGVQIPLVPEELGRTAHWKNRESAELAVSYNDSGAYSPFTLVLGHATSLVYEKAGTITARVTVGASAENTGSTDLTWRLAAQAALEATLSF
jgi:hypothetical protein